MPILGKAIANHIQKLRGLYSVELPPKLYGEMNVLVSSCNQVIPNRALLVIDGELNEPGISTTSWAELLGWRTDEDRLFVWQRGTREPDTSFQSVVKPFISSRFPGIPAGECTLDLLAEISIRELWRNHGLQPIDHAFDAFVETANWLAGTLRHAFEIVGSTPSVHWSDEFLVHWAEFLEQIDQGLAELSSQGMSLQPRHAWELVRISGLPVPYGIAAKGNPFLSKPEPLLEQHQVDLAKYWQKVIEEYLVTGEGIAVFLTALDSRARTTGASNVSSWRGLNWDTTANLAASEMVAAPVLGQAIFTSAVSPSLLSASPPTYPGTPKPAWWGVTDNDIKEAIKNLHETEQFEPAISCSVLERAMPGQAGLYWVKTRNSNVSHDHAHKRWKSKVSLQNLEVIFKQSWNKLFVSPVEPMEKGDGYAWIKPEDISLAASGTGVTVSIQQFPATVANLQLLVKFDLVVDYTAALDIPTSAAQGTWNPTRVLRIKALVRDCINNEWVPTTRPVEASLRLVIPSPFSPTVLVAPKTGGKVTIAPSSGDRYTANINGDQAWEAESTPDILLKEEGKYEVAIYNGQLNPYSPTFAVEIVPRLNGERLISGETVNAGLHYKEISLDDGDSITRGEPDGLHEIAVIKVRERSGNLSSGLLSAVQGKPAGQRPPSNQARSSLLGRYQDEITRALCNSPISLPNSLYQYVVSTGESLTIWPPHPGNPAPEFLFDLPRGFALPGVGNGPSTELVNCRQWADFMAALKEVSAAIGLEPGAEGTWLSGFNPGNIPGKVVTEYTKAHCELVKRAKKLSPVDAFWASYPFSIFIVDGSPGVANGQLHAVLLSPLHPARLTWAFSLAFIAGKSKVGQSLLGLAESWNLPFTGSAISVNNQKQLMVAIPTDPGAEQDFAAWSALAVLDRDELTTLPAYASGLPLPWGGQTGINQKVIERAIKDYLEIHPHINSLEIDIRSISPTPRSREIDVAVLHLLGGDRRRTLPEISNLGGGTRAWDSAHRVGTPPTRDDLSRLREEGERTRPFEWRVYSPATPPADADIAFIENSSVHLAPAPGSVNGMVGYIPLRRFCPTDLVGLTLVQNYSVEPKDDLLGLSELLAEIEHGDAGILAALQASPRARSLGIGMGAKWEVLGTFNIDPTLLSSVIVDQAQSSGKRLLWEWRPSWLGQGPRNSDELARRPYYVIGKVPSSLLKALEHVQGFSGKEALHMLLELGRRGIGLTSLYAAGGTQESAAAGFFYAQQLLLPSQDDKPTASWAFPGGEQIICGIVPVDPIESILGEMAGERLKRRADLLAVRIEYNEKGVSLCFVPIEVKHHGQPGEPEPPPDNANSELQRARIQLADTIGLLETISEAMFPQPDNAQSFATCYAKLVSLATILDLAMRFTPRPTPAHVQHQVIKAVLQGQVSLGVGQSVLLWFAPGSITLSGRACIVDPYGAIEKNGKITREVFIDPMGVRGLWWNNQAIGSNEEETRAAVDGVMKEAISACSPSKAIPLDLQMGLATLLGLDDLAVDRTEMIPTTNAPNDRQGYLLPEDISTADIPIPSSQAESKDFSRLSTSPATEESLPQQESEPHKIEKSHQASQEQHGALTLENGATLAFPQAFVGWNAPTTRWAIIGRLAGSEEFVALDFDHPKTIGVFGYMGSGKSYLLGTLIESMLGQVPNINSLPTPLATVIFNYRRNALDRFELTSLASPNQKAIDIERLAREYGAAPQPMRDLQILCLPGELTPARIEEYGGIPASELFFNPETLTVEDWELLMGEPGSGAVFARTIRHVLRDLRSTGEITLEMLEESVSDKLSGQSRSAAQLRFDFVRGFISQRRGVNFDHLLRPGQAVILDLRQPLFNKDDALRFFLICTNYVSRVQGKFNKVIVFDEAHEYLSNAFGEKIEARIRLMRHEGTSYIFATQDVESIPLAIRRFITTRFVFNLGTRENIEDLLRFAPEFSSYPLQNMKPGDCLVQSNESINNIFARPRVIHVRPRVTQHGGASRIFSKGSSTQEP
jgi:hypothetical protein